jgi:hypothetical protein
MYSTYSSLNSTNLWLCCSIFFKSSKNILLILLQIALPQLTWPLFPWGVSWGQERGSSPKGSNPVSRRVVSELQSEDVPILMRNGRLLRSSILMKKQDFVLKLTSTFGGQLLLQFVEKCNAVLCRDGCTLFQLVYEQNSIFVPEEKPTPCLMTSVYWTSLDGGNHCVCHSLDCYLVSGLYIWFQVASIVTRWLKNSARSFRNNLWSKHSMTLLFSIETFGNPLGWELSHV